MKTNNTEKYTSKEMIEKIGKLITGVLSFVSVIMFIGALLGRFDKNPVPFIIFMVIVGLTKKIEEKYPKIPAIVLATFEIVLMIICFSVANNVGTVASVKGGSPNDYLDITYESAFEDYFSNPSWKSVGKDEEGNEVVKFTGNCYYLGESAIAEIKFTLYEEQGSFVVSTVKINGQDIGWLGNVWILSIFDDYEQSH